MSQSLAVLRALWRGFLRDRPGVVMSFVVPTVMFLIFAAIFGGGSSDAPRLDVAIAQEQPGPNSQRLVNALIAEEALVALDASGARQADGAAAPPLTADDVRRLVKSGKADVGLLIRSESNLANLFGPRAAGAEPAIVVVQDPARAVAAQMVQGLLQKSLFTSLPGATVRSGVDRFERQIAPLTAEQRRQLDDVLKSIDRDEAADVRSDPNSGRDTDALSGLVGSESVVGASVGQNLVAYYAGGTAVMFLLFSMFHSAVHLHEERKNGLLDRYLAGPHGLGPVLLGRFLFMSLLGTLQLTFVFVVAWIVHGVPLPQHLGAFVVITLATAMMAAALGLAVVAWCRSEQQGEALATAVPLVLAAFGGSMVPRIFMPPFIRRLGDFTPNGWALDAFHGTFWRQEPLGAQMLALSVVLGTALVGVVIARRGVKRWETV